MSTTTDISDYGDLITRLDDEIRSRTDEIKRLETARDALIGGETEKSEKKGTRRKGTKKSDETDEVKARREENLRKAREARKANSDSKRGEIERLLKAGKKPAEIAEELDISRGYVYNTKRLMEEKAA